MHPAMPFDGILLASRLMVATEARTAAAVKRMLVEECEGIPMERQVRRGE